MLPSFVYSVLLNLLFAWCTQPTNLFTPLIDLEWTWKELCELARWQDTSIAPAWERTSEDQLLAALLFIKRYLNVELWNWLLQYTTGFIFYSTQYHSMKMTVRMLHFCHSPNFTWKNTPSALLSQFWWRKRMKELQRKNHPNQLWCWRTQISLMFATTAKFYLS